MISVRGSGFECGAVRTEPCPFVAQPEGNHEGNLAQGRVSLQVGADKQDPCPGCGFLALRVSIALL